MLSLNSALFSYTLIYRPTIHLLPFSLREQSGLSLPIGALSQLPSFMISSINYLLYAGPSASPLC